MSIAAAQYDKFREQVVRDGRAFTFTNSGELLVYPVRNGESIPFWSSRSRLESIQRRLPKYRAFQISELSLAEFWRRLDQLEQEGVLIGVNWSGHDLVGYNVSVADLRVALNYWTARLGVNIDRDARRPNDR